MLRSLRRKFVAIIMVLVGIVMTGMIVMSSLTAQSSFDALIERSLEQALRGTATGDDPELGMEHLPVLWIDIAADGVWIDSNQSLVSVDQQALEAVIGQAASTDENSGRVEEYHLTWKRRKRVDGIRIAVADTTSIDAARASQLAGDAKLGIGGMLLLLVIAVALSRWALAPVERAWEQQRRFVADASHELKTPLAVILANAQILRSQLGEMPEQSRRWVEGTAEEAERMRGLVEDLLELARTEQGRQARSSEDVDLSGVVEGQALQFDAVAFEAGCSIETDIRPGIHVCGDQGQLERLVKTLLDNACKYAARGSAIGVRLALAQGQAELAVTNQGAPIDPEDLPHLFDRFYRSDKARARETGGYGLGLAIAKGIVESHGGRIRVTSDEANGTTFRVTIPQASEAARP